MQRAGNLAACIKRLGNSNEVRLPGKTRWAMRDENAAEGILLSRSIITALDAPAGARGLPEHLPTLSIIRQSWFNFGDKIVAQFFYLERFLIDLVFPPDRKTL